MRNLFVLIALLAVTVAIPAFAQEQKVPPVDASAKGIAIKGYDTVAYFEQSQAVKGSPKFEYTWNGAKWLFATAAHRDGFAKRSDAVRTTVRRLLRVRSEPGSRCTG